MRQRLLALLLVMGLSLLGMGVGMPASAHGPAFSIVDLGTLGGVCCSEAAAVNDRGVVVGDSSVAGPWSARHAFAWHRGRMTDLGTLGGLNSLATDVNNRGEVVGASDRPDGTTGAFLWRSGRLFDLGTLGGDFTWATAINDRGDVVGLTSTPGGLHAFVWQRGMMRDLGAPVNGFSRAYDVNNRGQVVGEVSVNEMNSVPVRWQRGGSHRLAGRFGVAAAVNGRGQVAGYFYGGGSFLWSRGRLIDIGGVPGAMVTQAQGINDRGQVAGYTDLDAFLWQSGRINVLPRLTGSSTAARGINNRGQIVGYSGTTPDGANHHAVLWTR